MEPNQQPKQPETAKPADSQQKAQATESRALTSKPKEDGPRRVEVSLPPVLRFRPDVWAKLHHFCYRRQTEIGGFAVTSLENLLQVEEFVTVKQEVSSASVRFSDESVADYFDEQVDKGRKPEQIGRI